MQNHRKDNYGAEQLLGLHSEVPPMMDLSELNKIAFDEGIELTSAHLDVIQYLRILFEKHGPVRHARTLSQALEAKFATRGGLKFLYQLFPGGPITQGCKLAGVPLPGDSMDRSFGSVL